MYIVCSPRSNGKRGVSELTLYIQGTAGARPWGRRLYPSQGPEDLRRPGRCRREIPVAKRTKAVRAELVVRMPSLAALTRRLASVVDALTLLDERLAGVERRLSSVEDIVHRCLAETVAHRPAGGDQK